MIVKAIFAIFAAVVVSAFANAQTESATTDKPGKGPSVIMTDKPVSDVGAIKVAKVFFTYPKNGATVKPEFTAKFGVDGMKLANAGEIVQGTGHFHVMIDASPVKEGDVVPADASHIHLGKSQTDAPMKLAPGKHKLVLQFADGYHRAYGPELTQEISITVKK